ncbi:hypothetical protein K523DRAFT_234557 [Schizophyllum commune Tattone D]|nr:hypothetical protein K523DRAFT_234557 [Schizophyllum commune Tattone D]
MEVELDFDHQVNMEIHVSHLKISSPTLLVFLAAIASALALYIWRTHLRRVDHQAPVISATELKNQRDRTPGGSVIVQDEAALPAHRHHQNGTPYLPTYTPAPPRTSTPPPAGMFPRSPPSNTGPSNGDRSTSECLLPSTSRSMDPLSLSMTTTSN